MRNSTVENNYLYINASIPRPLNNFAEHENKNVRLGA